MKKKTKTDLMTDEERLEYLSRLNRRTMIINRVTCIILALTALVQLAMIVRAIWF